MWFADNWEYFVGGAAILGGVALMLVPGGQGIGVALILFGADVVIQKATTGEVNWLLAGFNLMVFGLGAAVARIVYLRTDPSGQVKPYIGQSDSGEV